MTSDGVKKAKPWFKFFPDNWRGDTELRMAGLAARGLWIDVLAIMAKAEPQGKLLVNGRQPTPAQLASLIGAPEKDVARALAELEGLNVFSRDADGVIYSRKMVRDHARSVAATEFGVLGGNPTIVGRKPPTDNPHRRQPDNGALKPSQPATDNGGVNPPPKPQRTEARGSEGAAQLGSVSASASDPPPEVDPATRFIALFDAVRVEVFGESQARPYPNALDLGTARGWLAAGLDDGQAAAIFRAGQEAAKRGKRKPIGTLKYFAERVDEALAQPMPSPGRADAVPASQRAYRAAFAEWHEAGRKGPKPEPEAFKHFDRVTP